MKKTFLAIILLASTLGMHAQKAPFIEPAGITVICSGEIASFNLLAIETNDKIEWEEEVDGSWIKCNEVSTAVYSILTTNSSGTKRIRCKVVTSNELETYTEPVTLQVNPLPILSIDWTLACEMGISLFTSNQQDGSNWLWILNETDTSLYHSPEFMMSHSGSQAITLLFTDQNGCSASVSESFEVLPAIDLRIEENDWFNSVCENSYKNIRVSGLDPEIHNVNIVCTDVETGSNAISDPGKVENGWIRDVHFKLSDTNDKELEIILIITDLSSDCSVTFRQKFMFYHNEAPKKGVLVEKPGTTVGLVFYVHDNDTDNLRYEWGYTIDNIDYPVEGNYYYHDFGSIIESTTYWVDVYKGQECQCKTRNVLTQK